MSEKKTFQRPEVSVDELQKALYEANCRLMESEKQRNEMFSNISHDLRSPLAAITSTLEYLRSYGDIEPDELHDMLDIMSKKAEQLGDLINNIFYLTCQDNHKVTSKQVSTNLVQLLRDSVIQYQHDISFEKRTIEFVNNTATPVFVLLDVAQFQRVLDNLMSNARKYTASDGTIRLWLSTDDTNAVIEVQDNGIGIAPELTEKIFERTYTVSDARTPGKEGCGLGLAIARSILQSINGSISCKSEQKKGSTFTIVLPRISVT